MTTGNKFSNIKGKGENASLFKHHFCEATSLMRVESGQSIIMPLYHSATHLVRAFKTSSGLRIIITSVFLEHYASISIWRSMTPPVYYDCNQLMKS